MVPGCKFVCVRFGPLYLFFLFLTVFFCVLYPRECHLKIQTLRSPFTCKSHTCNCPRRHATYADFCDSKLSPSRRGRSSMARSAPLGSATRAFRCSTRSPKHRNGTAEACSSASSENTAQARAAKRPRAWLVLRSGCERQQSCASNGTECHASKSARRLLRLDHQVFRLSSEELPCREHAQGNLKKQNVGRWIGRTFRRWTFGRLDIGHWTLDIGLGTWAHWTRWTRWTCWGRSTLDLGFCTLGHWDVGTLGCWTVGRRDVRTFGPSKVLTSDVER